MRLVHVNDFWSGLDFCLGFPLSQVLVGVRVKLSWSDFALEIVFASFAVPSGKDGPEVSLIWRVRPVGVDRTLVNFNFGFLF